MLGLFFAPLSLLLRLLLILLPLLLSLPGLVLGISFKVRLSFLLLNTLSQLELSPLHLLLLLLLVLHQAIFVVGHRARAGLLLGYRRLALLWLLLLNWFLQLLRFGRCLNDFSWFFLLWW